MRARRHPNDAALRRWLEEGDPAVVTAHLDRCDRCASRLELLAGEPADALRPALEETLAPPADMVGRVRARVAEARPQSEALRAVLDLFGAGWETMRLLSEGDEDG